MKIPLNHAVKLARFGQSAPNNKGLKMRYEKAHFEKKI